MYYIFVFFAVIYFIMCVVGLVSSMLCLRIVMKSTDLSFRDNKYYKVFKLLSEELYIPAVIMAIIMIIAELLWLGSL